MSVVALRQPEDRLQRLVDAAHALKPLLAEHAIETERIARTPEPVLRAVKEAGMFRMCQPERHGGAGLDKGAIHDVCSVLAEACPSTAWVVGNLTSHETFLAQFDARAQADVWETDPTEAIGSSFIFPAGKARRVPDGWLVSGRWPYSSGIHAAGWCIVGAIMDEGEPSTGFDRPQGYFLLHRDQYRIIETWRVAGLRGTGSDDVQCEDAFVPDHRFLDYRDMLAGTGPGFAINTEAHWRFPIFAAGGFVLVATMCGAARGAVAHLAQEMRTKAVRVTGKAMSGMEAVQAKIGEASAIVDTVDLIARSSLSNLHHALEQGRVSSELAIRLRRDSAYAARLCVQAVDIALDAGGGTALFEANPIQRAWRDVHAGAAHAGLQWTTVTAAYGRTRLGQPSGLPGIDI